MFRQRNPTDPTKVRRRIFRGIFSSRHPLEGRTRAVSFSAWRGRNPKRRKTARPTFTTTGLFNRRIWRSLVKVKQRDDRTNEKLLRFRCDHYTIVYIFLYVYVYVMYLPVYVQYMIVSICVFFELFKLWDKTISNGFTASRMDLEIGRRRRNGKLSNFSRGNDAPSFENRETCLANFPIDGDRRCSRLIVARRLPNNPLYYLKLDRPTEMDDIYRIARFNRHFRYENYGYSSSNFKLWENIPRASIY